MFLSWTVGTFRDKVLLFQLAVWLLNSQNAHDLYQSWWYLFSGASFILFSKATVLPASWIFYFLFGHYAKKDYPPAISSSRERLIYPQ